MLNKVNFIRLLGFGLETKVSNSFKSRVKLNHHKKKRPGQFPAKKMKILTKMKINYFLCKNISTRLT